MKKIIEGVPYEFSEKTPVQQEEFLMQLQELQKKMWKGLIGIMNGVLDDAYANDDERSFMLCGWPAMSEVALIERVKDYGYLPPEYYAIVDVRPQLQEIRKKVVFTFSRYLFLDESTHDWMVCGAGLILPQKMQGRGFGKRILDEETELYRSLGCTTFFLPASLPMGIYFFAREGFDFVAGCSRALYCTEVKKRLHELQRNPQCVRVTINGVELWRRDQNLPDVNVSAQQMASLKAWDHLGQEITFDCISKTDIKPRNTVERKGLSLGKTIFLDNAKDGDQVFWKAIKKL